MLLSEAIRDGAKQTGSMHGAWFRRDSDGGCHTCAVGAAYFAATNGDRFNSIFDVPRLLRLLPLAARPTPCPAGCEEYGNGNDAQVAGHGSMINVCSHLFEIHEWSREAIAEWVETVEKSLELKPEPFKDKVQEGKPVRVVD